MPTKTAMEGDTTVESVETAIPMKDQRSSSSSIVQGPLPRRMRFRRTFEKNWNCRLKDSLPDNLKPRVLRRNGARVGHNQQDRKRILATDWPTKIYRALAHLSNLTVNDMEFAHAQLKTQVKIRQRQGTHREHYAREVLTSDIEAIVKEVKRLASVGRYKARGAADIGDDVATAMLPDLMQVDEGEEEKDVISASDDGNEGDGALSGHQATAEKHQKGRKRSRDEEEGASAEPDLKRIRREESLGA